MTVGLAQRETVAAEVDLEHELTKGFAAQFIRLKVRRLMGRFGLTSSDRRDIEQELKLRLIESFPTFNPEVGHWRPFVVTVTARCISKFLRLRCAQRRGSLVPDESLSSLVPDVTGARVELGSQLEQRHLTARTGGSDRNDQDHFEMRHDVAVVLASLPPDLRRLCKLLKTCNQSEAARKLGIARTTLRDKLEAIRQAFEEAGLHESL